MRRMQTVHRARRVQQVDQMALKIRSLEAAASRHGEEIARERDADGIAQLLIAQYKAQEDEEAAQELREQNRRSRDDHQHENELDTLRNHNEQRRPRSPSDWLAIAASPLRTLRRQSREPDARQPSFRIERAPSPS